MVDLQHLRQTIERSPADERAAVVTRSWLREVEQDLQELADRRAAEERQA